MHEVDKWLYLIEMQLIEVAMERLISLFREPDDGQESLSVPREPVQADLKVISDEPIYFQQLLEYLKNEKRPGKSGSD